MRNAGISGVCVVVVFSCVCAIGSAAVYPPPLHEYDQVFADASTGDNMFTAEDYERHWFVTPYADRYQDDVYERPTAQTFKYYTIDSFLGSGKGGYEAGDRVVATDTNDPAYFGYLDVVRGYYHASAMDGFMYFAIEVYSDQKLGSGYDEWEADFGESSLYNIRLSNSPSHAGAAISRYGLLLSADAKDFTSTFTGHKLFGYYDKNGDVGGYGVSMTKDDGDYYGNGYEMTVISDGKDSAYDSYEMLYGRRVMSADGRPVVEFAFNYEEYNRQYPHMAIDPNLTYLSFEATRGLKGQSNYLFNDQYSFAEAGSPYYAAGEWPVSHPQNIYELDTLSADFAGPLRGDFNSDGMWDCSDINALVAEIAGGSWDPMFDMNRDGELTVEDITDHGVGWLAVAGAKNPFETGGNPFLEGDANLDGAVDVSDFNAWNASKFTHTAAWCNGDFNADGSVDCTDFNIWNSYRFMPPEPVFMVPEPATGILSIIMVIGCWLRGIRPHLRLGGR